MKLSVDSKRIQIIVPFILNTPEVSCIKLFQAHTPVVQIGQYETETETVALERNSQ